MDFSNVLGFGLTRSQKMKKSFWGGIGLGSGNAALDTALIGFQASNAGRGALLPSIVGQSVAVSAGIPMAGFAAAAVSLVPGIGPAAAVVIGEVLAGYGELRFGSMLIKKFRMFSDLHKNIRHLEMGGNFQDSELAQRQRFLAVQDMNSSMIPGRRYLGQEALLMHR